MFPLLQEYANIAYNNNNQSNGVPTEPMNQEPYRDEEIQKKVKEKKSHKNQKKNEAMKPVVPVTSIDMPDWSFLSYFSVLNVCSIDRDSAIFLSVYLKN